MHIESKASDDSKGRYSVEQGDGSVIYRTTAFGVFDDSGYPLTIHDTLEQAIVKYGNRRFLGERKPKNNGTFGEYKWMTYSEAGKLRTDFGSGLLQSFKALGMSDEAGWKLGIFSINRPEWVIADYATHSFGGVSVPLYETFGVDAIKFIIDHSEIRIIVCSGDKIETILRNVNTSNELRSVISMDPIPAEKEEEFAALCKQTGLSLTTFEKVAAAGRKAPAEFRPSAPNDLATLCYTSGTTGNPKGVQLSQRNLTACIPAFSEVGLGVNINDSYISYLPLAHIFERTLQTIFLAYGGSIGFYSGDVLRLVDDIQVLRPTIFASVPRLLNKIYAKIRSGVDELTGIRGTLFQTAYSSKLQRLHTTGSHKHRLWDALVFRKISALLGGRIRVMISGAAPMSPEVLDFLQVCIGCTVLEGYGATETSAFGGVTRPGEKGHKNTGIPCYSGELKLIDVPDMGYTTTGAVPRGEILIRGPFVSSGYYKMTAETAESFDKDGWFHTGDIGEWNDGLAIIDRRKNIFKLAQGEYVAAEKLESVFSKCPYVAQIFIHGDSLQSHVVCIVVPDPEKLLAWGKTAFPSHTVEALAKTPAARAFLIKSLRQHGLDNNLKGFEIPKNVYIEVEPFTPENGLLTPTFKLKRNEAKKLYADQLQRLYDEQPPSAPKM